MNVNYINLITNFLKASILLSIIMIGVLISQNQTFRNEHLIASAITFDLVITLPIAFWLFFRKFKFSKIIIIEIAIFGIILASFILPSDNRLFLNYLMYFGLPIVEIGFLTYAGIIFYKSKKAFNSQDKTCRDFLENLRIALIKEFPSEILAKAVTFEIAAFYYAFVNWKAKKGENLFSYHKKNGVTALLAVFGFLIAVETFVLHFLIAKISVSLAWILSAFSIYFLFQIFAHGKAIFLRPTEITENKLFIRCGLLGDCEIELANISSIEQTIKPENDDLILSPLGGFSSCNLKLTLKEEAVLNGIYGRKKNFKTILIAVDGPENFKNEIERNILKTNSEENYGKSRIEN